MSLTAGLPGATGRSGAGQVRAIRRRRERNDDGPIHQRRLLRRAGLPNRRVGNEDGQ
jgi:hypothetical protein